MVFIFSWFTDSCMEGDLQCDIFTHKLTTSDNWEDLVAKPFYPRKELAYENYVTNKAVVEPSYDLHCADGDMSGGCEPIAIVPTNMLLDYTEGPPKTKIITSVLDNGARTGQFVIDSEAPTYFDFLYLHYYLIGAEIGSQ